MLEPDQKLNVDADACLWWRNTAAVRTISPQHVQYVLPLINPPYSDVIEGNPEGLVRPPVSEVRLAAVPPSSLRCRSAWLLSPDETRWAHELAPLTEGERVSVLLPVPVKYWSVVVMEFRE